MRAAESFRLSESGSMSTRQRARFMAEARTWVQEKDRARLKALRAAVADARTRQAEARRKVIARCKLNRQKLKGAVKAYRVAERDRINQEVDEMRAQARKLCALRKTAVRAAGLSVRAQRSAELEAERHLQRELQQTAAHAKRLKDKHKRTAKEVRAESDDEVRGNIDADLVPVFDRVRRSVRGDARRTRTEAFLHYVEENPQEVIALQQQSADVDVKRLLAEQAKAEREATKRSGRSYKPSKAELREYLQGVPF